MVCNGMYYVISSKNPPVTRTQTLRLVVRARSSGLQIPSTLKAQSTNSIFKFNFKFKFKLVLDFTDPILFYNIYIYNISHDSLNSEQNKLTNYILY